MHKWIIRILLLIGYCVPYAFLSMNGDATSGTMLFYVLMIISYALLCWIAIKSKQSAVVIVGNICSFLSSYFFILQYQTEKWSWYFKPFAANGLMITISVIAFLIQLVFVYKYNKKQRTK